MWTAVIVSMNQVDANVIDAFVTFYKAGVATYDKKFELSAKSPTRAADLSAAIKAEVDAATARDAAASDLSNLVGQSIGA